jgi:hypothetical protein
LIEIVGNGWRVNRLSGHDVELSAERDFARKLLRAALGARHDANPRAVPPPSGDHDAATAATAVAPPWAPSCSLRLRHDRSAGDDAIVTEGNVRSRGAGGGRGGRAVAVCIVTAARCSLRASATAASCSTATTATTAQAPTCTSATRARSCDFGKFHLLA